MTPDSGIHDPAYTKKNAPERDAVGFAISADLACDEIDRVEHLAGIAPLVVVPGYNL